MSALKTALIILTFALITFLVMMALGYFTTLEPFHSIYLAVSGYVEPAQEKLTEFMSNPTAAISSVGAIGGLSAGATALYSKLSSAKTQLNNVTTQAQSQINSLKSEASTIKSTLTAEKDQLTSQFTSQIDELKATAKKATDEATAAKTQLSTVQSSFSDIEKQKAALQLQVSDLKQQLHDLQLIHKATNPIPP